MVARRVIGLTGDVGGGKSTVRAWLEGRGAAALDADRVVHRLLAEDAAVGASVRRRFGADCALSGGGVDRRALAALVFADAAALADLEAILHPAVVAATRAWLAAVRGEVAVVEAVKLIEAGMAREVDQVWLVVCDATVRRVRLAARGWSADEVARRLAAGTPLGPRLAVADVVIDNSGPWSATGAQLAAAWGRPGRPGGAGDAPGRPAAEVFLPSGGPDARVG